MPGPDELRQCLAVHAQNGWRCELKVTEMTTHIDDHKHTTPDGLVYRWTDMVSRRATAMEQAGLTVGNGAARLGQVGGTHYAKHKIQPWDVWDEYDLDRYTANAVKYLLRGGDKPGNTRLQDLKKARHYLDKAIEMEEARDE